MLKRIWKSGIRPTYISKLYAKLQCCSNGTWQIVPNLIYDENGYAKKKSAAKAEPTNELHIILNDAAPTHP